MEKMRIREGSLNIDLQLQFPSKIAENQLSEKRVKIGFLNQLI